MADSMIYVIGGWTGEYSDHRMWLVRAYSTEAAANAEAARMNAALLEAGVHDDSPDTNKQWDKRTEAESALRDSLPDAQLQIEYTGVSYGVLPVPLGCGIALPPVEA